MTHDVRLEKTGLALSDMTDIDPKSVQWLQGDPENPELGFLILYQREQGGLGFDYDLYSSQTSNRFQVTVPTGEIKGEATDKGGFPPLEKLAELGNYTNQQVRDRLTYFRRSCSENWDEGPFHMDIILVPYAVDNQKARNAIFANYIHHHLPNPQQ